MVAALVAGSAQIAGPTPTVLLQAVESGIDLVVVAATSVLPGRDASGLTPADMTLWVELSLAQNPIKTPIDPATTVVRP
jgi:hypothetical protein